MTAIKKLIDGDGNQYFPQTHTKAVVDDNGYSVESRMQAVQDVVNQAQMQIGTVPNDLAPTEDSTNWVTSGGVFNAIKAVQDDLKTIFFALGNYAFPMGKPSFPWEGDISVTNNLVNVSSSNYKVAVRGGDSYTTILSGTGLYAVDDSSVVITMGGADVTSSVYNTSTHTISIASITGDITITAIGMTYASSGLVLQLDGIQQGDTNGVWTDLARGVVWTPTGATKLPNGWYFDGQSYMLDDDTLGSFDARTSTVEVCINSELPHTNYFLFVDSVADTVFCYVNTFNNNSIYITRGVKEDSYYYGAVSCGTTSSGDYGYGKRIISYNGDSNNTNAGYLNGTVLKAIDCNYAASENAVIGKRITPNGQNEMPFKGTLHSLRVYNRKLSLAEMLQNQKIDNERFKMGLNF